MNLDNHVSLINQAISNNMKDVIEGRVPDMFTLESHITSFVDGVKSLPAAKAQEYRNLLEIWSVEVRKISDKLAEIKKELEVEMSTAQIQGRAANAYTSLKG